MLLTLYRALTELQEVNISVSECYRAIKKDHFSLLTFHEKFQFSAANQSQRCLQCRATRRSRLQNKSKKCIYKNIFEKCSYKSYRNIYFLMNIEALAITKYHTLTQRKNTFRWSQNTSCNHQQENNKCYTYYYVCNTHPAEVNIYIVPYLIKG